MCMHCLGDQRSHPWLWEASLRLSAHCPRACLSERYSAMPDPGPHLAQAGYVVTQFLDGSHLLIQVMSLSEITQMGIILSAASLCSSSSD